MEKKRKHTSLRSVIKIFVAFALIIFITKRILKSYGEDKYKPVKPNAPFSPLKFKPVKKSSPKTTTANAIGLSFRQREILSLLKTKNTITTKELSLKFPNVTNRTLRRDMDVLEKKSLIRQHGKTKNALYKVVL